MDLLPDSLILQILSYLSPRDIVVTGACSRRLRRISADEVLWRTLFHSYFKIKPVVATPFGRDTWKDEFIRLIDEVPSVEAEVIKKHTDEVLHVSFSKDGKRFATCGKDAYVHVWRQGHPTELEFSRNMEPFNWQYTQYSEFNSSDTLLLVSGVLQGLRTTTGDIAVFNLEKDFMLQCRVRSKPYDVFGAWYSDRYLFAGDLRWLGHLVSLSSISLNKTSQETESEHIAIINEKYCFYNPCASSIRSLVVAKCVDIPQPCEANMEVAEDQGLHHGSSADQQSGTVAGLKRKFHQVPRASDAGDSAANPTQGLDVTSGAYKEELTDASVAKRRQLEEVVTSDSRTSDMEISLQGVRLSEKQSIASKSNLDSLSKISVPENDVIDPYYKWLIFTCGSETYTSHQIGFKRIPPFSFKHKIEPGPSIKERRELRRQRLRDAEDEPEIEFWDYSKVGHLFDEYDHVINLHGHIIGMTLSPDHRYLYVNSRPWPPGYQIADPLEPPPIAQEIDVHIIDMSILKCVGMMKGAHKAYTPNDECFFIFLDAADLYLGSGAEDKHAYIWDRHYQIPLMKLPHDAVCNSVAFNSHNSEMLVSVSDDMTIKVWRSPRQCREVNMDYRSLNKGTELYQKQMPSERR